MAGKVNTLRISEFKGLNRATNPHNVDDKEFTELTNWELSKDRALTTRKGYTNVCDMSTLTGRTLYKASWDDISNKQLYMIIGKQLYKIDEGAGTASSIAQITTQDVTDEAPAMIRYKDKVLVLPVNDQIKWFDVDEEISTAELPEPYTTTSFADAMLEPSAGGELKVGAQYEYQVSFTLGEGSKDGETSGMNITDEPLLKNRVTTKEITADNQTIATITQLIPVRIPMSSYTLNSIKLWRKETIWNGETGKNIDTYGLLDEVTLEKYYVGWSGNWYYKKKSDTYSAGVIGNVLMSIDSPYYPGLITCLLDFTDDGTIATDVGGSRPYQSAEIVSPRGKYLSRLVNRILIGNVTDADEGDTAKKKVYYSYRGYNPLTLEFEIPGYLHPNPMLIFPTRNFFYCDREDVDDPITGMHSYKDKVFIFTEKCTFVWAELMKEPVKIASTVGCVSNQSVVEYEGKLVWLDRSGVCQFDGRSLKNISHKKMNPYFESVVKSASVKAVGTIYNRQYWLSLPVDNSTKNSIVLVYDFDIDEWFVKKYRHGASPEYSAIDGVFTYYDGADETLYGVIKNPVTPYESAIIQLDNGYSDGGTTQVIASLKTKYYDFKAPDMTKVLRGFYVDIADYSSGLTINMYIDNLEVPYDTFSFPTRELGDHALVVAQKCL